MLIEKYVPRPEQENKIKFVQDNQEQVARILKTSFETRRDLFKTWEVHYFFGDLEIDRRINLRLENSTTPVVILEVGTGQGNLLSDLKEMREDFGRHLQDEQKISLPPLITIGLDIQRYSKRKEIDQITADAHQLPLRDESVDFVISVWTMHYVADKLRVLEEVYRVLKLDGEAFIHLPFDSTKPDFSTIARKAKLPRKNLLRNQVVHLVKNTKPLKFPFVYSGFGYAASSQIDTIYKFAKVKS